MAPNDALTEAGASSFFAPILATEIVSTKECLLGLLFILLAQFLKSALVREGDGSSLAPRIES